LNELGLGFCGGHSSGASLAIENIESSSKIPIKNKKEKQSGSGNLGFIVSSSDDEAGDIFENGLENGL